MSLPKCRAQNAAQELGGTLYLEAQLTAQAIDEWAHFVDKTFVLS